MIVGIDIRRGRINEAIRRSMTGENVQYMVADAYRPPFNDDTFHLVLAMNNLYYAAPMIDHKELTGIFEELKRITKPAGYILISGQIGYTRSDYLILQKRHDRLANAAIFFDDNEESQGKLSAIKLGAGLD